MSKLKVVLTALVFGISFSTSYAQDHSQHQQGSTTDHSQHQSTAAVDHMAHLQSDMEEIRNTKDVAKRKEMLTHHLQMMREHMQELTAMEHGAMGGAGGDMAGMDHSKMGAGGNMPGMEPGKMPEGGGMQGMDHGGMMQHHEKMVQLLQHMLETQEQILGLIETK